MPTWQNWSGRLSATPARITKVRDEADVVAAVREAGAQDRRVRCVGAAHSHAPLVGTDGMILDLEGLSGVVSVDTEAGEARIRAGTRIHALGPALREHGAALLNQGDIDRQAIAGAVATGTHGTGPTLRNFSAAVRGARLVLASGEVVDCDAGHDPELFQAARLSLGALGVVTELRLAIRPAYRLEERMWLEDLDTVLDRLDERTTATRHFEFFWTPGRSRAVCKALDETDAEPRYPLAEEGARLAWSYDVFANDRPDKHSEMEYSVRTEDGVACLREIRELVARDFPTLDRHDLGPPGRRPARRAALPRLRRGLPPLRRTTALGQGPPSRRRHAGEDPSPLVGLVAGAGSGGSEEPLPQPASRADASRVGIDPPRARPRRGRARLGARRARDLRAIGPSRSFRDIP